MALCASSRLAGVWFWRRQTLTDLSTSPQTRHWSSVPDYSSRPLQRAPPDVSVHVSRTKSLSEMPSGEADHLNANSPAGYGTLPSTFTQNGGRKLVRNRRVFPPLSSVVAGQNVPGSTVSSPGVRRPASFFANIPPFHRQQLTYDPPLSPKESEITDSGRAARVNGIRVWYSSFTSIDWLHDAVRGNPVYVLQMTNRTQIKDSRRMLSLRRRKSLRGRAKNALDRATGWVVVTIVGLLAAITAFTIVRFEQWLFDLKEGYCTEGIFRAKRFCCPMSADSGGVEEPCAAWETWAELLGAEQRLPKSWDIEGWLVEYLSYIIVAVSITIVYSTIHSELSLAPSGPRVNSPNPSPECFYLLHWP